ncbi:MAG: RNA methyltransferase [Arachidicoccus sp.]|nr:RNA methyltransferase [Arachidicoccus sp.]
MALSLPEAFLSSLENSAGFDKESFVKIHNGASAITSIRYNPVKINQYKGLLPADKVLWNPYGYYLSERPSFTHDPLFHGGLYYVQEAGSQFLWEVLSQTISRKEDIKVLDVCAAPGGKSTLLSSYFHKGLIVANEVIKSRVNVLSENITKWGTGNIVVTNNDPQHFSGIKNYFDVVLIDAPCSGSGLFRKDNSAIAEWSEEKVVLCSKRQQRILSDIYPALKQNGLLIYSTCSYSPQEDEEILDWLTDNFSLENIPLQLQNEWNITTVNSLKYKSEGYKFFPDRTRSEGFFIAAFRKKDGEIFADKMSTSKILLPDKNEIKETEKWIDTNYEIDLIKHFDSIIAINKNRMEDVAFLQKHLYIKKAGTEVGEIKNKGLVPAHDLALSSIFAKEIPVIYLDKAQSLQYLKRKDLYIDTEIKGWAIVNYEGVNLGWVKVLPNRINNYYPNEWRILKD